MHLPAPLAVSGVTERLAVTNRAAVVDLQHGVAAVREELRFGIEAPGVAGAGPAVLVFGLRGNAFRSEDGGRSWAKVAAGLPASIVAGASISDGAVVLADAGGRIVASVDAGRTFMPVPLRQLVPLAGIGLAGKGQLALAGLRGVLIVDTALTDRRISNGER